MSRLFLVVLLLIVKGSYSQNYELGKVTAEELGERYCPFDTSAAAAYVFKDKITTYGVFGRLMHITSVKLKIYKKDGYDYANISQTYLKSKGIKLSDAFTYNLVNGKIVKTELGKESIFKNDIDEDFAQMKLVFPNIREGSIIEYKITSYENNLSRPVNFYFQEEIPVKSIILTVEYPATLQYNKSLTGFLSPSFTTEKVTDHLKVHSLKNRDTYQLLKVPSLADEGYVNNINNYRSKIHYELASSENEIGEIENYATDWKIIAAELYKHENFGEELAKANYFEKELDQALLGKSSRDEKISIVLAFVKEKVKWNKVYGVLCDKGVKKAYSEKMGNVADINLMLTAMLRHAGFLANPVLITTRSKLISAYPSLNSNNYVISCVEAGNDLIMLDATSEYSLPNILPIRNLNSSGKLLRQKGTWKELDVMPKTNSEEVINIIGSITPEMEISGKVRATYSDYNALVYRETSDKLSIQSHVDKLEKKYAGLEVSDFELKNATDLTKPVIEQYAFRTDKNIEKIGDKIYFSPMLFFTLAKNPFKQETREYPVDFVFPNKNKLNISLTIPEGYAIEALPGPKSVALPNNLGNFKYNISVNENQIQVLYTQDINQAVIEPEYYGALKNFFKAIVAKQTEKIVLKKV